MKYVGAHVSAGGGVENAPLNALKIGARAFALFTKNQRQWAASPYTKKNINEFKKNLAESGILPEHVLPHDSYLINIGNPDPVKREKSVLALLDEAARCEQLDLKLLNFHPGSHLREISEIECMQLIAAGMNEIIQKTDSVILVLETTAGQGSNVGYQFEQLKYIIDLVDNKARVGVCLDTCHIFAAGYELRTKDAYDKTMQDFGRLVGFQYLKGMHINDSKSDYQSKVDRHESIGRGKIGLNPFSWIMNDYRLDNIPLILETIDESLWPQEINLLYQMVV